MYIKLIRDTAEKRIKGWNLKHDRYVERTIEHTTQKVAWEISWLWWLEKSVKWTWKVSSEYWRQAAGIFQNTTGTVRSNTVVSIKRWFIIQLHIYEYIFYTKACKLDGENIHFNIINNNAIR